MTFIKTTYLREHEAFFVKDVAVDRSLQSRRASRREEEETDCEAPEKAEAEAFEEFQFFCLYCQKATVCE